MTQGASVQARSPASGPDALGVSHSRDPSGVVIWSEITPCLSASPTPLWFPLYGLFSGSASGEPNLGHRLSRRTLPLATCKSPGHLHPQPSPPAKAQADRRHLVQWVGRSCCVNRVIWAVGKEPTPMGLLRSVPLRSGHRSHFLPPHCSSFW